MRDKNQGSSPRWMNWIIQLYCKSELLEDLQGDLHEYYARNLKKSRSIANLIFFIDVLKFCRLYTIRKPKIIERMTFFNLISNYFKTSTRSLARNKLFSSINIIGLAISMSIGILMITYLSELLSYDSFHEKADRTYRVLTTFKGIANDEPYELASTSVFIGKKLKEEYTGIEEVLVIRRGFNKDIKKGESIISVEGHYSTEEFFDVLSFRLISGDASTALLEPYSLVLTKGIAEKLFNEKEPVGETVQVGEDHYTITGIMDDLPTNSHIQFEVLASFSTIENEEKNRENSTFLSWRSVWMNHVYLLLPEDGNTLAVLAGLNQISEDENAKNERYTIDFQLESLRDIVPGKDLSNQIGPSVSWSTIYRLVTLTLLVIFSACFNYTNLSIARSLRRAKEVGVRKVVGATRSQVFTQFVFEAVIISLLALFISYGLYLLLKPQFIHLILEDELISMNFEWIHGIYFLLFAIAIGFLAGALPSVFLSKLKAISVLGDISKVKLFKGVSVHKILVVLQFAMSMGLIIGATISYRQYKYSVNFDLGFTTENILNIPLNGNDSNILMNEIEKLPEVTKISRSSMVLSTGSIWTEDVKYKDPLDSITTYINFVDKSFVNVHEYKFLAGGTFPFDLADEESAKFIVIDEILRKRLNFETPESAVGEVLTLNFRQKKLSMEIVGVVGDFQYDMVGGEKQPCGFIHGNTDDFRYLNLVVKTSNTVEMMNKLEKIWTKADKVHPFEALFYDDQIQEAYAEYSEMFKIMGFLAFLAISIAAMGLLGMAVFTTETRMKEISIRKVMGASEKNLVYILTKGFMFMLFIAALIAVPATYFLFESVILVDYVDRVTIGIVELLSGVLLIFIIGILMVSSQTFRAVRTNPADMLRNE